ncbi:nucleolar protein 14 homolog [Anopheles maculipalpis]|uniref:nucleolar protein 14 homolog n=1 Tax=Anopheles maculipalpis TaxID=1496333 RepID=UPI0021596221|nr:nucleolar protein 14 homolog [Anopheles maculipalpis]
MCGKLSKKTDVILRREALTAVQKANPFETVVTKSKHAVLNRGAQSKHPGKLQRVSNEKRGQTLGKEFALLKKTNRFLDARINSKYARGPSKKEQSKELFNLILTHGGRTMHEIESFDDLPDGAGDDEDEVGMLQESFTRETHFGGGSDDERPSRDRKTVIEEMIAESKRQKSERQQENDEVYDMRQKLDEELKNLMPQLNEHIRKDEERPKPDDFDQALREMIFEPRGVPTEKLKTVNNAATEQNRREVLDREKQERMQAVSVPAKKVCANRPLSADALCDEYVVEDVGNEEDEDDYAYGQENGTGENDEPVSNGSDAVSDDDAESSDMDSLVDLKAVTQPASDKESNDSEADEDLVTENATKPKLPLKATNKEENPVLHVVDVPRNYEQFEEMLEEKRVTEKTHLIASMVHTLKQKNFLHKSRWSVLFAYVLNYVSQRFTRATAIEAEFQALHQLTPLLHDIVAADSSGIGQVFQSILEEKYSDFKNRPRRYPDLSTLVFLKLVPLLFSASDRRHSIVTPAMVFIGEILSRCQVRNRRDISRGLLLVTTVLECLEHSKRFLPSAIAFLMGVLGQACTKDALPPITTIIQPFRLSSSLLLTESGKDLHVTDVLQLTAQDLLLIQITTSFKVRAIACAVSLVTTLCKQLEIVAAASLAKQFLQPLNYIQHRSYPWPVQKMLQQAMQALTELSKQPLVYLVQAEKKPKPLRLLEPKINFIYEDIRRRPKTAIPIREQRRKIQQKIKKVMRGAKREIRLDNDYIAKLQHKRRMENDRDRHQKVRQIFSHASSQQAEFNSLEKRAKYRK